MAQLVDATSARTERLLVAKVTPPTITQATGGGHRLDRVLRLLEFETALDDDQIDALISNAIAPIPAEVAGLSRTIVGRRLMKDARRYLIATLWSDRDAMEAAIRDGGVAVYQPPFAPYLGNAEIASFDLASTWTSCPSRLDAVRLFRGPDLGSVADAYNRQDPGPHAARSGDDPGPRPCLILASRTSDPGVIIAGWSEAEQASSSSEPPESVALVMDIVHSLSRLGRGTDYLVTGDQRSPSADPSR